MEKKVEQKKLAAPQQSASYVVSLPQPPVRNATEYLKAYIGYIYTAVGAISQEVSSIDLHLYKATFNRTGEPKIQEVFEHPALSLLHYVNQVSTLYDVLEATQTYLELTGEAYWVVLKNGKVPTEFWLVRPDWVKVIPSATDVIDHYNYYAGGVMSEKVEIPKENVIPFKYFNPLNPYRGKGATQAAALPFDILNFAQEYNRNFFFNSAIPSMVFSSDQKISEVTQKRFLAQWQSTFGGRTKSNKVAFLGNGLKLDKASFGAKELDFTEQQRLMRDDVLAVFKVPKTILGLTDDVNRANADATTRAFMERVITPRMKRLVDMLNEFYLPMFQEDDNSLFFDFTDPSPEDVDLKLKRYASGRQWNWLTPNEIRAEENLEPLEGGDELFPVNQFLNQNFNKPDEEKPDDNNPNDTSGDDEDTTKPTGDEDEKGLRALLVKWLGGKILTKKKAYAPPTYLSILRERKKHMVRFPVKRPVVLQKEIMVVQFVPILKKYIAELISTESQAKPLLKKKSKRQKDRLEDLFSQALKKVKQEKDKEDSDTPKNSDMTEEQKVKHWKEFITNVTKREGELKDKSKEIFDEQQEMVLERLYDQSKNWRKQRMGVKATAKTVVPSLDALNKMWNILEQLLREIYIEQGNYTMDFLGLGGNINITTEFASQYLLEYGGQLISGINTTTRDDLMSSLSAGYDEGESVDQLADRVKEIFKHADDVRAEMIARTESIKASNAATVEAYRQSEGVVIAKEWLAERDNRTCDFCLELDGKAIELDSNYFDEGDTFTAINDSGNKVDLEIAVDVGEPPVHVDCRCTTIPVIDTTTQGEPEE